MTCTLPNLRDHSLLLCHGRSVVYIVHIPHFTWHSPRQAVQTSVTGMHFIVPKLRKHDKLVIPRRDSQNNRRQGLPGQSSCFSTSKSSTRALILYGRETPGCRTFSTHTQCPRNWAYNAAILGVRKGHVCVCVHVPRKHISVLDSIWRTLAVEACLFLPCISCN